MTDPIIIIIRPLLLLLGDQQAALFATACYVCASAWTPASANAGTLPYLPYLSFLYLYPFTVSFHCILPHVTYLCPFLSPAPPPSHTHTHLTTPATRIAQKCATC